MRTVKLLAQVVTALLGFIGGWAVTLVVLMRLMTPASGCDAPCDAPAYAAVGLSLLAGPVVGVLTGVAGVLLVSRLFRRRIRG